MLRSEDEICMSEIFYAGGTAEKNISAHDLIKDLQTLNKAAFFIDNRNDFVNHARSHFTHNCVLLLMGARDPSLEHFAKEVWTQL